MAHHHYSSHLFDDAKGDGTFAEVRLAGRYIARTFTYRTYPRMVRARAEAERIIKRHASTWGATYVHTEA